jgi:hypothetical protein
MEYLQIHFHVFDYAEWVLLAGYIAGRRLTSCLL